jgi:protein SCO1/2
MKRELHEAVRFACHALQITALIAVASCDPAAADRSPVGLFSGVPLTPALEKPAFTLAATDSSAFEFRRETDGRLTLLFFGYTHCPDVCPVHFANLAAIMQDLSAEDRQRVRVVFVTVDPTRDSLPVIRAWLDQFATDFIGLRGSEDEVQRIQTALSLPPSTVTTDSVSGEVAVGHATQVLVFTADNRAHVMYPFGTRQSLWARDMPALLRHGSSSSAGASLDTMQSGALRLSNAVVTSAIVDREHGGYLTIRNEGADDDVLLSARVAENTTRVTLHGTTTDAAGRQQMQRLDSLVIPAASTVSLTAGTRHLMLASNERLRRVGQKVPLELTFRRAGVITVPARVVPAGLAPGGADPTGGRNEAHDHSAHAHH